MEVEQQLEFFSQLTDAYNLDRMRQSVANLQRKMKNHTLHLAVVGEFSCGKSTFINALIGRRILKEAVMPTTACATYISKGVGTLSISVEFADKKFRVKEGDFTSLLSYLQQRYDLQPDGTQQLIDTLTSDQIVARDVKAMHLAIPHISLPDHVVIIDTPGFNPGDVSVQNHFEVTRRVVTSKADAALVLMPSDQPFSNSLRVFMHDYLNKYLHRCVFVLTMGDHKTPSDRQLLLNYVKGRLLTDFKMEEAKVFCESAITTLPVVRIPDSMKPEWTYWQKEFVAFKTNMWNLLIRNKEVILSEHLHNLALDLVQQLQRALTEKQTIREVEKQQLENSRIEHIDSVTAQLSAKAKSEINRVIKKLTDKEGEEMLLARDACKALAVSKLSRKNAFQFHEVVEPIVANSAHAGVRGVLATVNEMISKQVKSAVSQQLAEMRNEFNRHYSMFSTLRRKAKVLNLPIDEITLPDMAFSSTNQLVFNTNSDGGGKILGGAAGGAAAGAVIGSIVPVIGTSVGAVIGAVAGAFFGGKKSDQLAEDAFPLVTSTMLGEIDTHFLSVRTEIEKRIDERRRNIHQAIEQYAHNHVAEYGEAVENLIRQQEKNILLIQQQINSLKQQIRMLEDIKDETTYTLIRLKEKQ